MRRYTGGEVVNPGLYFNVRHLSFRSIEEPGPLVGGPEDVYRRVPLPVLLIVGPMLGLAYVVFLPFIGLAMVLYLVGLKAGHFAADVVTAAGRVVRPGWEPSMAFLSRSRRARAKRVKKDAWAEDVRQKLDEPAETKDRNRDDR